MPSPVLTAFNSGELSPLLDGRTDLQKYGSGCRTLENFLILPQGGAERRPGTEYIGEAKNHDVKCRLIPFVFSEGVSAILEFGHLYMRVWRDGGQVTDEAGDIYELTTPFLLDELFQIAFVQSADVIYMAHRNHFPQKLSREGWADWTIEDIDFEYGAFKDENIEHDIFITPKFDPWATATAYEEGDIVSIDTLWSGATTYAKGDVVYKTGDELTFYKSLRNANTNHDPELGSPWWEDTAQRCFRSLTDHTSGAGHATPPGNTTDWEEADKYYAGEKKVTLYATSDIFEEKMVGGLWLLRHPRDDNTIEQAFKAADVPEQTEGIRVEGTWTFVTHGNWGGKVGIERSFDDGVTWQKYREYSALLTAGLGDRNVDDEGEEDLAGALYRLVSYEDDDTAGTCRCDFTVRDYLIDGTVLITDFIDASTVKGTVAMSLGSLKKTNNWAEGAWSEKNGYPAAVTIFEERLVFAGSIKEPQTMWFSKSNDYEDLTPGELDNSGMTFTLSSDRVDAIKWLVPKQELMIGTSGGEWKFGASKSTEPLTPTNLLCRRQSTYGSGDIQGLLVNDVVMFFQEYERVLRELAYSFEKDLYVAPSLNVMSEHICESGVVQNAYQRHPYPIVWCCRNDGQLATLTYNREEEVVGWSRQITDGEFESVAVITGDAEDEVWVVVKRIIDGDTKRYVERFEPRDFGGELSDSKFLDCHLSLDYSSLDIARMYSNYGLESDAGGGYAYGFFKDYHCLVDWDESMEYIYCYVAMDGATKKLYIKANSVSGDSLGYAVLDRVGYVKVVGVGGNFPNLNAVFCNNQDVPVGTSWLVRRVLAMDVGLDAEAQYVRLSGFDVDTDLEGQRRPVVQCPGNSSVFYILSNGAQYIPMSEHPEFLVTPTLSESSETIYTYGDGDIDALVPRLVAAYKYESAGAKGLCFNNTAHNLTEVGGTVSLVAGKSGQAVEFGADNATLRKTISTPPAWNDVWLNDGELMLVNYYSKVSADANHPEKPIIRFGQHQYLGIVEQKYAGKLRVYAWFRQSNGAYGYAKVMDATVTSGWHMMSIVVDPASHTFYAYVDATLKGQNASAWDGTLGTPAIMPVYSYQRYILGSDPPATVATDLDELSIFKPLSSDLDDAITALYNSGTGRFVSSSVVTQVDVDEGTYAGGGEADLLAKTVSNLSHLEGESVQAVVDGACHIAMTVDGGAVSLESVYSSICIGLPYESTLETMRIEGDVADGGSHERKKRIAEVSIRFKDTVNGRTVSPEGEEDIIYFRNTEDPMGAAIPMFSGDKKVKFSTGFNKDMTVKVIQDSPMPMTILLISPKIWTYQ
jgi:hypothetical protein